MKEKLIIANWKSEKTVSTALEWISQLDSYLKTSSDFLSAFNRKKVILCPSFVLISVVARAIKEQRLPLALGSQDISRFSFGAYTGEVNAEQLKEFVSYTLIGHSERRTYFKESNEILQEKVIKAHDTGIFPVYCVQGMDAIIPNDVNIVAYEPVFAIGTGTPDTPSNAGQVATTIKQNSSITAVLYGGSVSDKNIAGFMNEPSIDGVLVGKASLDPITFANIVIRA